MAAPVARHIYGVSYTETAAFKDTYGGEPGHVFIECMLIAPENTRSDTVLVFSHPVGGGGFLPAINALAKAGHHVLFVNTRYRGNDSALIMEKCLLDLGAGIKDAKKRFGYTKVILGGWSGGGSLSLYYQEQADHRAHARRRARGHQGRRPRPRRRHHAHGRAREPLGDAHGMDGCVHHQRARPERTRSRAGPLLRREPQPAALFRRLPRALSRRATRAQPPHHGLGAA
jgi:hypothetical protein